MVGVGVCRFSNAPFSGYSDALSAGANAVVCVCCCIVFTTDIDVDVDVDSPDLEIDSPDHSDAYPDDDPSSILQTLERGVWPLWRHCGR